MANEFTTSTAIRLDTFYPNMNSKQASSPKTQTRKMPCCQKKTFSNRVNLINLSNENEMLLLKDTARCLNFFFRGLSNETFSIETLQSRDPDV
jgi:hypothetical protein